MSTRARWIAVFALIAGAVLALAAWGDHFLAHGLRAEWRQEHDGRLAVVARTLEPRTTFPNAHRALSRYVQAWPFDRWGLPDHLPRLDARLSGTLDVPPGPARSVRLESPNHARLFLDGREITGPADVVRPGPHAIEIYWDGTFEPRASLIIDWTTSDGGFEPIPSSAFTPAGGASSPLRTALWIGAALLALGLGALGAFAMRAHEPSARARRLGTLATLVLVLLAVGYRSFDYSVMPDFRENYDELFATWNGWSLLEEGTPRGWTLWPGAYAGDDVHISSIDYFTKRPLSIVEPYFEHPPLLHLLVGAVAIAGGATHWSYARLWDTRLVPIALSALTVWLLIAVGRRLDPRSVGPYFGALLYAVLPMIALQGRVIKEEDLVVPMVLGSLLFYLRWRDEGERTTDLAGAALLAGGSALAKIPGLVFLVALVMLVLSRRKPRQALIAAGFGLLALVPLLIYAAAIDWNLFWQVTLHQANGRPSHWNLYPRFFDDPLINHNLVGRTWLLFLWLAWALALRSFRPRDRIVLTIPLLLYILGMGLTSGNWTFGWYFLPIYPFLCLGAGRFLADMWDRPDLLHGALFMVLAVMYGMNFVRDVSAWKAITAWPETRRAVTAFLVVALAPYAVWQIWPKNLVRRVSRGATALGLAAIVFLSGYFVVHYDTIYETHRNFDRMEFFDR